MNLLIIVTILLLLHGLTGVADTTALTVEWGVMEGSEEEWEATEVAMEAATEEVLVVWGAMVD
jgi:hypothetical protein